MKRSMALDVLFSAEHVVVLICNVLQDRLHVLLYRVACPPPAPPPLIRPRPLALHFFFKWVLKRSGLSQSFLTRNQLQEC